MFFSLNLTKMKINFKLNHLLITLLVIFIIGWCVFQWRLRESFTNLGVFPKSVDDLILNPWYPKHKPEPELSFEPQWKQYKNYPVFPARSNQTNNIKYWRQPNNGQCSPNNFCGKYYDDWKVELPCPPQCPGFDKDVRVNYYNSDVENLSL